MIRKEVGYLFLVAAFVGAISAATAQAQVWTAPGEDPPQLDRPGYIYNLGTVDEFKQSGNLNITGSAIIDTAIESSLLRSNGQICFGTDCKSGWDQIGSEQWTKVTGSEDIYRLDGSVGIGKIPDSRNEYDLEVYDPNGVARVRVSEGGSGTQLVMGADDVINEIFIAANPGSTDYPLHIYSGNLSMPALRLQNGNVGINMNSQPGYSLQVAGRGGVTSIVSIEDFSSNGSAWTGLRIARNNTTPQEQWYLGIEGGLSAAGVKNLVVRRGNTTNDITISGTDGTVGIGGNPGNSAQVSVYGSGSKAALYGQSVLNPGAAAVKTYVPYASGSGSGSLGDNFN